MEFDAKGVQPFWLKLSHVPSVACPPRAPRDVALGGGGRAPGFRRAEASGDHGRAWAAQRFVAVALWEPLLQPGSTSIFVLVGVLYFGVPSVSLVYGFFFAEFLRSVPSAVC